jgi:hypothetical protein
MSSAAWLPSEMRHSACLQAQFQMPCAAARTSGRIGLPVRSISLSHQSGASKLPYCTIVSSSGNRWWSERGCGQDRKCDDPGQNRLLVSGWTAIASGEKVHLRRGTRCGSLHRVVQYFFPQNPHFLEIVKFHQIRNENRSMSNELLVFAKRDSGQRLAQWRPSGSCMRIRWAP